MLEKKLGDLIDEKENQLCGSVPLEKGGVLHYLNLSGLEHPDCYWAFHGEDEKCAPTRWRFYSRAEFNRRLASMRLGDPRCLEHGRPGPGPEEFESIPSTPPDESKRESEEEKKDNELQTKDEAELYKSADLLKSMGGFFQSGLGKCDPGFTNTVETVTFPLSNGRIVPLMTVAYTCSFGNIMLTKTLFPVTDPFLNLKLDKPMICSTEFRYEDTRRVVYKQTTKSTKIGIGLSLGFSTKGGMQMTSPKKGDKAFAFGDAKMNAETGADVKFNFELCRTHSKLKIEAFQHLVIEVPEIKCKSMW